MEGRAEPGLSEAEGSRPPASVLPLVVRGSPDPAHMVDRKRSLTTRRMLFFGGNLPTSRLLCSSIPNEPDSFFLRSRRNSRVQWWLASKSPPNQSGSFRRNTCFCGLFFPEETAPPSTTSMPVHLVHPFSNVGGTRSVASARSGSSLSPWGSRVGERPRTPHPEFGAKGSGEGCSRPLRSPHFHPKRGEFSLNPPQKPPPSRTSRAVAASRRRTGGFVSENESTVFQHNFIL
jgi:hypothetical protein